MQVHACLFNQQEKQIQYSEPPVSNPPNVRLKIRENHKIVTPQPRGLLDRRSHMGGSHLREVFTHGGLTILH